MPEFNEFVSRWIELLKTKTGQTVEALLEDAIIYLEGKEALEKYAKKLHEIFPRYYVYWFEDLLINEDYEKLMDEADKAFECLATVAIERYLVGNMVYIVSKKLKNSAMMHTSSKVMFQANPCVRGMKSFYRGGVI